MISYSLTAELAQNCSQLILWVRFRIIDEIYKINQNIQINNIIIPKEMLLCKW